MNNNYPIEPTDDRLPILRLGVRIERKERHHSIFIGEERLGQILRSEGQWLAFGEGGSKALSTSYDLSDEDFEVGINFILACLLSAYDRFLGMIKTAEGMLGNAQHVDNRLLVGTVWAVKLPGIEAIQLDMRVKLPEGMPKVIGGSNV